MGKIKEFLDLYINKNSKSVYRSGILTFFDFVYGKVRKGKKATKEEFKRYEELAERYFSEDRDHFDDLLRFSVYLHKNETHHTQQRHTYRELRSFSLKMVLNSTKNSLKE